MNISENMKLHQWAQAMADQKASGLTRQQWCDVNDIPVSTFDYRCKKVRAAMEVKLKEKQNDSTAVIPAEHEPELPSEPLFAKVNLQVPNAVSSGISIKMATAEVTIAPDTPAEHVRMALEALAYAQ